MQESQDITPQQNHYIKFLLGLAIVLIVVASIVFVKYRDTSILKMYGEKEDPVDIAKIGSTKIKPTDRRTLSLKNEFFAKGESLISKDPESALEFYKKSLELSTSTQDEESIRFRIAYATLLSGNRSVAFQLYREIISNEKYSGSTKAYAVQAMLQDYYSTPNDEIFGEIFKDGIYLKISRDVGEDRELALRKLAELGSSFEPLPLLELRIASYEVDLVEDVLKKHGGVFNEEAKSETKNSILLIQEKVRNASVGAKSLVGTPNSNLLPNIYNRLGVVVGKMSLLNIEGSGEPTSIFDQALKFALLSNNVETEGYIRYNYARYLSQKDPVDNKTKIIEVLSPTYKTTPERMDKFDRFYTFLKTQSAKDSVEYTNIIKLASIDKSFSDFLIKKLGWSI